LNFTQKLENKAVHIVSFDVPFSPNYGGIIDVYNRAKALKDAGWKIHLHCFEYGRGRDFETSDCATKVHYYNRKISLLDFFSFLPFIVKSRADQALFHILTQDNHPVLLEGQHTAFFANRLQKAGKKVLIRQHNVEWEYYRQLAQQERSLFKKWFFILESYKLKIHLYSLKKIPFLAITPADTQSFQSAGFTAHYLPPVLTENATAIEETTLRFGLFHGKLSVQENHAAVLRLCDEHKKSPLPFPVKIAGINPSDSLRKKVQEAGFELIANPSHEAMEALKNTAAIHFLLSTQVSGIKFKLLESLKTRALCIATPALVAGSDLAEFCSVWDEQTDLSAFVAAQDQPTNEELTNRWETIASQFHPIKTTALIGELFA
jgi:hypothetical protein